MDEIETGRQQVQLALTRDELQLVRTALRLLEDTLGREEAEELHAVQAILKKVEQVAVG